MSKKAAKKPPASAGAPDEKKIAPAEKKAVPAPAEKKVGPPWAPARQFKDILVEKVPEGNYAVISFNRPDHLNAFTTETLTEVADALQDFEMDPDVRCVVFRGTKNYTKKPSFTVGRDLSIPFHQYIKPNLPLHMEWVVFDQHRPCDRIETFPKPLICAVDGYALGGGTELAMVCDIIIASKRSTFGLTEVARGLFPAMGGTQRLARFIGIARAKWMIFTGAQVPAQTLYDWGMIAQITEDDKFEEEVHELACKIGKGPTTALYLIKKCMNYGLQVPLNIGLKFEDLAYGINSQAKDLAEGIRAFFTKKEPDFKGT
jgi:enoyl-CoA hydratase/3-hydroxyacyl-CoA dehydrogenase